jgi:hypothetical protein
MWGAHFRVCGPKRLFYTGLDVNAGKPVLRTQRYGKEELRGRVPDTFSLLETFTGIIPVGAGPRDPFYTTARGKSPLADSIAEGLRFCSLEEAVQYAQEASPLPFIAAHLHPLDEEKASHSWAVTNTGIAHPQTCTLYGVQSFDECRSEDYLLAQRFLREAWRH